MIIPAFLYAYICVHIYILYMYMCMCMCDLNFDKLMVRAGLCPARYCGSNPCGMY